MRAFLRNILKKGGKTLKVRLTDYQKEWQTRFEAEARLLTRIFGKEIISIEHFGSTAVPGMKAKPVIDMMGLVRRIETVDGYASLLEAEGYEAAGEWGIEGRRLFRKGGDQRTHHLHFYQQDNSQIDRHLILRDYLLQHPEEVEAYSRFKEKLAAIHESTSGYSPAKKKYVAQLERRALAWRRDRE